MQNGLPLLFCLRESFRRFFNAICEKTDENINKILNIGLK